MTTRRLAAILAADVAGFSAMMERDEEGTAAQIRKLRAEVIEPALARHHGRLVKTTGDGFLAEFASPVEAVRSALAIQEQLAATKGVSLRIGINLGDIIIEDDGDVLGDGVNVAARLEQIAEPGGVCISGKIHAEIEGKIDRAFHDRGEQQVKNIARPVRVYALAGSAPNKFDEPLPIPDKPSIAVLPFINQSGDPGQDYFADAITDDVTAALSKARWLVVLARNSAFAFRGNSNLQEVARRLAVRYLLSGSVRKSGSRVRVSAQLTQTDTAATIWAERYDRDLHDLFALQDALTADVAGAIEPEVLRHEGERAIAASPRVLSAWDLVGRAVWEFHKVTSEGHHRARELLLHAIRIDPESVDAHIWLARASGGIAAYDWSPDRAEMLRVAIEAGERAVQLEPSNPYAHYAAAVAYTFAGNNERASIAAERALSLYPTFAAAYLMLGVIRLGQGRIQEAIAATQHGLRLNQADPQNFSWLLSLALAHYLRGDAMAAMADIDRALHLRPDWAAALKLRAVCEASIGEHARARETVARMKANPQQGGDPLPVVLRHYPEKQAEMDAILRSCGE